MIDITRHNELIVHQIVEGLEAITGFETQNRYEVLTPEGEQVMYAYEESGGLSRFFLKTHRPLDIHVVDTNGSPILTASREFFWFLSHLNMNDDSGRHVGALNRQLGFKRRFILTDRNEQPLGEITGSLFRPFTFFVNDLSGQEIGRVTKQWGGFMREGFTDADTFQVLFDDPDRSEEFRLLLLTAAFAIDLDFFER